MRQHLKPRPCGWAFLRDYAHECASCHFRGREIGRPSGAAAAQLDGWAWRVPSAFT